MQANLKILSDVTIFTKYAKYIPDEQRRESWDELAIRNMDMHIKKYPFLREEITSCYTDFVIPKKVLPSMRSLQFGGRAIELTQSRMYNCCYLPIDDWRAFHETMFLLLGGSGVGFSVQRHHVKRLPSIRKPLKRRRWLISDDIIGWAEAVKALVRAYLNGKPEPIFDYRDIRKKDSLLVTTGGKAPGPEPLKATLIKIHAILDAKENGSKLTTLECHDICCHIADAVYAGGIRRAALISGFDMDDDDMIKAKCNFPVKVLDVGNKVGESYEVMVTRERTGTDHKLWISDDDYRTLRTDSSLPWYYFEPQRGRSNNSGVFVRHKAKREDFEKYWKFIKENGTGEPGVYFTNNADWFTNPCFVGDTVVAVADGRNGVSIEQLASESNGVVKFPVYCGRSTNHQNAYGPTKFRHWKPEIKNAVAFCTGTKKVIELVLSNGDKVKCTPDHQLATKSGDWVDAKDSKGVTLGKFFTFKNKYRHINSFSDGHAKQYRMLWEFENGILPENHAIDHIENNGDDFIQNLQLLKVRDHDQKTATERMGLNNPIHKISANADYRNNLSVRSSMDGNVNFSGLSDHDLIEMGKELVSSGVPLSHRGIAKKYPNFPKSFSKNRFGGKWSNYKDIVMGEAPYIPPVLPEKIIRESNIKKHQYLKRDVSVVDIIDVGEEQKVYDLTVEDNHNFYILTSKADDKFETSEGILVHNCCEIALRPYGFCNLCEINAGTIVNQLDFVARARAAAFIGTLQAGYTDFHYLRDCWRETAERDALLGVSLTGIASMDMESLDFTKAARVVNSENKRIAKILGISEAARTTCVKPAGTTTLTFGRGDSGIHAWMFKYYIRRMGVGKAESIYKYFAAHLPELLEDNRFAPDRDAFICIPVEAPDGAIVASDESALEFLDRIYKVSKEWVKAGHRKGDNTHNVSATVYIKKDEWGSVGESLWENRDAYNGLAVLPYDDNTYIQAPHEEITKERYEEMVKHLHEIDLSMIREDADYTKVADEIACAGGACNI